jgi:hypothetical protein
VPRKIIAGICFPKVPVGYKCPHMTLLTNEWPAKRANDVVELTCLKDKKAFVEQYEDLRANGKVK